MVKAGIDVGALSIKVVLLGNREKILGYSIIPTKPGVSELVQFAFDQALESAHLSKGDVAYVVSTGYGRRQVPFANME